MITSYPGRIVEETRAAWRLPVPQPLPDGGRDGRGADAGNLRRVGARTPLRCHHPVREDESTRDLVHRRDPMEAP
ncbi:hypothetical protein [Streptomyces sp. NPDC088801]|uniref:hypothetical protein n=1 Tax=Streptomyces sp. NPDC088801 TaxID=3365903 RepID=UPI0038093B82